MRAAVLYEVRTPLRIEDFDLPDVGSTQVRVRLAASGVCHSDWHVVKGDWPHIPVPGILGHEGAGIVAEVGPEVTTVKPGDHVVLSWKRNCGVCEMCQRGYPNLCDATPDERGRPRFPGSDRTMDKMLGLGTFGTETIVPEDVVIPIDDDIPLGQAALVGCGVMTGVGAVINTAQVEPGMSVAVFGCGGVGLNCIQGAALVGADPIIAIDIRENKLQMAKTFGATHVVNAAQEDPVARIRAITGGPGVHYAFEAIGLTPEPFIQSIECTRKRGLTVYVGHAPFNTPVTIDARILMPEKMVMGSMYGTARPRIDFPRLLRLYKDGRLRLDELVSREYALDEVNEAFAALDRGEVARSILRYE
jgi:S-(hydroxymethyl)glutathione dehydrogenase / alcohol dehydrogenase